MSETSGGRAPNGVEECLARWDGWICNRERGHPGYHIAHAGEDPLRSWPALSGGIPRSLSEPSDTEMLDWWFSCGLHDSVCEGSVDLWWADEEDGDAVERVTHGTTLRETLAMAMRGEYLEDR